MSINVMRSSLTSGTEGLLVWYPWIMARDTNSAVARTVTRSRVATQVSRRAKDDEAYTDLGPNRSELAQRGNDVAGDHGPVE